MTNLPNHYRRLLGFDGQPRLQPDRVRKRLLDIQLNGTLPAAVTVPAGSHDHTGLTSSAGSMKLTTGTAAEDKAWWRGTTTYSIGARDPSGSKPTPCDSTAQTSRSSSSAASPKPTAPAPSSA